MRKPALEGSYGGAVRKENHLNHHEELELLLTLHRYNLNIPSSRSSRKSSAKSQQIKCLSRFAGFKREKRVMYSETIKP
jgi:hypothetical protein